MNLKINIYNFSKKNKKWNKVYKKINQFYDLNFLSIKGFGNENLVDADFFMIIVNKKTNLKYVFEVAKTLPKRALVVFEQKLKNYSDFGKQNNENIDMLFFENKVNENFYSAFLQNFIKNSYFNSENLYIFHNEVKDLCVDCIEIFFSKNISKNNRCKKNYLIFKEGEIQ
ncbi:hypothetical protein [Mesoplasma coleopterae]|uniref:Uncharacterized protein n=1 Tax=Mesoplasma coleopterae TaxID=324078 RepID=A0A2K8P1G2_9MOLU|nr:hypothetical protein [Mesoplasma coleopterae]ATZ20604.1 hypothetical protein MCOLE_v1c00890 [Mesoplasma coleopterae]AVN62124.1 hypothetical protein CG001_00410 [Mesoplasma coleopterae]AVN62788.1 hypothetical protein CG000_00460 [Mesoplasma coleopterae]